MVRRPRWSRWALLGGAVAVLGGAPVAARSDREAPRHTLSVAVEAGDSVWTIARQHADPERDVREVVDAVLRANGNLDPSRLQPGEVIEFPAELLPDPR